MIRLSDILVHDAILPNLEGKDRDAVVQELLGATAKSGVVAPALVPDLLAKILARELISSTGFGHGVAVPHVKHAGIKSMSVALGLSGRGVDFSSLDKQPVYTVFLLLSPDNNPENHLRAMEVIFKNLSKDTFRRALRQCHTSRQVLDLITDSDSHQLTA